MSNPSYGKDVIYCESKTNYEATGRTKRWCCGWGEERAEGLDNRDEIGKEILID